MKRQPVWVALAALAAIDLVGCASSSRSTAADAVPVIWDIGTGSPDAVARRSARELADSEILAARAPRAGASDGRFAVRFPRPGNVGSGTQSMFETMFENALVGTGSFLLVDDEAAPIVSASVAGPLGAERSRVRISSAAGDVWIDVRGHLEPSN